MATRLDLQTHLENILGSRNVYFQPPESIKLSYPCFIYSSSTPSTRNADNSLYFFMDSYNIIYIDRNPENHIAKQMCEEFQYIQAGSSYVTDNLYHYTFDIYY